MPRLCSGRYSAQRLYPRIHCSCSFQVFMKAWARRVLTADYSNGKTWAYMDKVGIMHTGASPFKHQRTMGIAPLNVPCELIRTASGRQSLTSTCDRSRHRVDAGVDTNRAALRHPATSGEPVPRVRKDRGRFRDQQGANSRTTLREPSCRRAHWCGVGRCSGFRTTSSLATTSVIKGASRRTDLTCHETCMESTSRTTPIRTLPLSPYVRCTLNLFRGCNELWMEKLYLADAMSCTGLT